MQDAGISGIKEKSESAITTDVITRMNKPLWLIADKKRDSAFRESLFDYFNYTEDFYFFLSRG